MNIETHDQQHPNAELGTSEDVSPPRGCPFPIVGIGASAGGLEAFTELIKALPPDTGMAFVLVQHLDPNQESHLQKILAGATSMPVHTVTDGSAVEPDNLYVVPPNAVMVLRDGLLRLSPREPRMYLPIDVFFRSLATEQGGRSICVVLSGNASDGSQGLVAVKSECGVTFAQEESTARFGGMPHNAIATGAVDFVLPPAGIARELARLGQHRFVTTTTPGENGQETLPEENGELKTLLGMLLRATKVDFTDYKRTTIRRRIGRRMIVKHIDTVPEYLAHCRKNVGEIRELYRDLLTNASTFFREPAMFQSMKAILKESLAPEAECLRVWVPGCGTGEEVYSLAICLSELLQQRDASTRIQIFGTDISEPALDRARAGVYAPIVTQDLSAERLDRFFDKVDQGFQIGKPIRDLCIFARHDVTRDPPFARLDIVSCRDVLVYMGSVLQNKVIPIFHYSLNPSGVLLLGSAENLESLGELFDPLDRANRIFGRRKGMARLTMSFEAAATPDPAPAWQPTLPLSGADLQKRVERVVQERYAPAGVVIDSNYHILQFRGRTSAYLDPAPGNASLNLLRMAHAALVLPLRHAVKEASGKNSPASALGHVRDHQGIDRDVNVEVTPIPGSSPGERYFLIMFNTTVATAEPAAEPEPLNLTQSELERQLRIRERELTELRAQAATLSEDHAAHIEELQAANEEVSSSNEELQSTNEELSTTKEELESANEELTTLNEELSTRNQQLNVSNDDLANVLGATNIPVLIIDIESRIRRFTGASEKLLGLKPIDVGRPLANIHHSFSGSKVQDLVQRCLQTLVAQQEELQDEAGRWYSVAIRPYRTTDGRIAGAVISFINIDPLKQTLTAAERERDYAERLIETVHEPLIVLDGDYKVLRATKSFYYVFHVSREETEGRYLFSLGNGQWSMGRLRELLTQALFHDRPFQDFEVEHDFPHIGRRTMRLNGRVIPADGAGQPTLLLAIDDVTERKEAAEILYRRLFETAKDGMLVLDGDSGAITDLNPYVLSLTEYPREHFIGKTWDAVSPFKDVPELAGLVRQTLAREVTRFDVRLRPRNNGREIPVEILANAYTIGSRKSIQCNIRDVTERERVQTALRESERRFRLFVESVQDYALFQFNLDGRITTWNPGAERLLGHRENEIVGEQASILFTPEDVDKGEHRKEMDTARREGRAEDERWHIRKDGTRFWSSGVLTLVRDDAGVLRGYAKVMRDITERKNIEEELRAAVIEKEVLIKEIHHRVKNNLQVVTSLLNLQSGHITDLRAKDALEQTRIRLRAIATIHDLLYRSGSLARVEMEEHIRILAPDLYSVYGVDPETVKIVIDIRQVSLEIEQAIPCTLMINELLSNALEYAFPEGQSGEIVITLSRDGEKFYCLSVEDNGIGLPPGLDFRDTQSMGLQLINIFVDQLQGSIRLDPGTGTHFEIRFPVAGA